MNNPEAPTKLSPDKVLDLKHWLFDNPQAIGRVCTRLAVESVEVLHGTDLKKSFEYALIDEVGDAAIENHETIRRALFSPTGEWPEDASVSPESVSQEVESIIAREQNG